MVFPATFDTLASAGYHFSGYGICKGCGASIEWWITPSHKNIPLNYRRSRSSAVVPHHSICPNVEQFRRPKQVAK